MPTTKLQTCLKAQKRIRSKTARFVLSELDQISPLTMTLPSILKFFLRPAPVFPWKAGRFFLSVFSCREDKKNNLYYCTVVQIDILYQYKCMKGGNLLRKGHRRGSACRAIAFTV